MTVVTAYVDQVQKAYIAYYGRPADATGLDFWTNKLAAVNGQWGSIIDAFGNSAEATNMLANMSNEEKINTLYQQMFGRSADPSGLTYYAVGMANGTYTLASIAVNILNGAQGNDATVIANKLASANMFTTGLDTTPEMIGYNSSTVASVRTWLGGVTAAAAAQTSVDGVLLSLTTTTNSGTATTFTLTPGTDSATANQFLASETYFNVDGKGPTLNTGDSLTGTAGRTDNTLTVTDLTPGGIDNIPAGVTLSNIQNVNLNSSGNTAGGTGFSTVGYADVRNLTGTTNGAGNDVFAAANGANGTVVNVTHNGLTGALNVIGGTNVTATMASAANAGAVTIGQVNTGAGSNATGAVVVNHAGSGAITSYAGTTQNITSGGGAVVVGDATGVAPKTSGAITVTDTAAITYGNTGNLAPAAIATAGGADVNITTNAGGPVTVGNAALSAVNPTGNVTVTDTVGQTNAVATATAAGLAAGTAGTAAYEAAYNGAYAPVTAAVTVNGGVNDTVNTSGAITINKAAGAVVATNTDIRNSAVNVGSGTDVTVTTSGTGIVNVGSNSAATNPTGAITVTDTGGTGAGAITVLGGSSATVNANGNAVTIGGAAALSTVGAVAVTQAKANTVTIDGGSTVAVTTVGGNVTVGTTTAATGAVTVTDTFAGPSTDAISVLKATGPVTINTTATSGNIIVGEAATLNAAGTALLNGASNTAGTVTINDSVASNTRGGVANTTYGTGTTIVRANGSTSVSVTGGTGGATITDLQSTAATGGAGAGQPIGVNTLATVTLDNAGNSTLTSNALTAVNIANSANSAVTVNNATSAHALALNLSNNQVIPALQAGVTDTVTDNKAGVVTVTTTGTVADNLNLTANTATKVVFNNAAAVTATIAAPLMTSIDATGSTGGVTTAVGATTSFAGGTGASHVTVAADPTLAITGGSGTADEYIANYNYAANALVTGFETLTAKVAGANVGAGFSNLHVNTAVAATFNTVNAGAQLSLDSLANAVATTYNLAADTANDSVKINLGLATDTATTLAGALVTATKVENVTVNSLGAYAAATPAPNTLTLTDTTLKSLTVTGTAPVAITAGDKTNVKTITIAGNSIANDTVSATINGITSTSAALTTLPSATAPAAAATALALAINTTATPGVTAVASGNTVVVTSTAPFSLSDAFTNTGGGVMTISAANTASGLASINASAATGAVTVDGATLAIGGATITGGAGLLSATGVNNAKNGAAISTVAVTGTVLNTDTNTLTINYINAAGIAGVLSFTNVATPATAAAMATALKTGILALGGYGASGITVTDNTAGTLTVTGAAGVQITSVTATPVAGADVITVATSANPFAANDVFTTGAGGGTITVGQGGIAAYTTQNADKTGALTGVTPVVTYAAGSETVNLGASKAVVDTVKQITGGDARVNDFQVTANSATSDVLTFVAPGGNQMALANVTVSTPMNQTIVPGLNYTAANGVITFVPTGVHTMADYTVTQLVSAVQAVLAAAGANTVAAFQSGSNTYVVQDPTVATTSLTVLNGVTGITGFTGTSGNAGANGIAAQNTIVSTNLTNNANAVVVSSSAAATTTDATGYSVQNVTGAGTGGLQTITNLASQATVADASTGTTETLNISQVGAAGGNSLVYNSTAAHTVASLTVTGDAALTIAGTGGALIVNSIVDGGATNTLSKIFVTGGTAVTLGGFTDSALTTIDGSAAATGLNITDALANQTITASTGGNSTIVANGNNATISQKTGAGNVTLTANGYGDTITLSNGTNTITASSSNDNITVGTGANTITATGANDTITVAATSVTGNTITVGLNANVTLSAAAAVDSITLAATDVTGALSSGSYAKTTITNMGANDTLTFANAGVYLGGNAANALVNVSGAATVAAALDMAASAAVKAGQPAVGVIDWFQFGGDTYFVEATGANHPATGLAATDFVVKLTGLVTAGANAGGTITMA
ncbi:MAG: DUF4214 domain-containing protein [Desulfobacteraceae bacterium]|nr:DUF4214 domain-containing protein [Desulfobacteraceae bacterium]